MTHQDSFKEWLAKSNNDQNWSERYDLCIRAISDYIENTESLKGVFFKIREKGFFSILNPPKPNSGRNKKEPLNLLQKLNSRLDEVKFDSSSESSDAFYSYQDSDGNLHKLTTYYWKDIRTTALDQYARYLHGLCPSQAIQADYIRYIYRSEIEKRLKNIMHGISLSNIAKDRIFVLEPSIGTIIEALDEENYKRKLHIKKVFEDLGRIEIHVDLKSINKAAS